MDEFEAMAGICGALMKLWERLDRGCFFDGLSLTTEKGPILFWLDPESWEEDETNLGWRSSESLLGRP